MMILENHTILPDLQMDSKSDPANLTLIGANNRTDIQFVECVEMDFWYYSSFLTHIMGTMITFVNVNIHRTSNGLSCKTQQLFLLAAFLRFFKRDECKGIFVLQMLLLFSTTALFLAAYVFRSKEDAKNDPFRIQFFIVGAFIANATKDPVPSGESITSLYMIMEAIAMMPQYALLIKTSAFHWYIVVYIYLYIVNQISQAMYALMIVGTYRHLPEYTTVCREMSSRVFIVFLSLLIFLHYVHQAVSNKVASKSTRKEEPAIIVIARDKIEERKEKNLETDAVAEKQ